MKWQKSDEKTDKANESDFASRQHNQTHKHAHNLTDCPDLAWVWGEAQSVFQCEWKSSVYLPVLIYKHTIKQNWVFYTSLCMLRHVQACLHEKKEKYTKTISNFFMGKCFSTVVSIFWIFNLLLFYFGNSSNHEEPQTPTDWPPWPADGEKKKGSWEMLKSPRMFSFSFCLQLK